MIKQSELREFRKKLKLNQTETANLIHCTLRMYQYYESMQKVMPKALLELLFLKLRKNYDSNLF